MHGKHCTEQDEGGERSRGGRRVMVGLRSRTSGLHMDMDMDRPLEIAPRRRWRGQVDDLTYSLDLSECGVIDEHCL